MQASMLLQTMYPCSGIFCRVLRLLTPDTFWYRSIYYVRNKEVTAMELKEVYLLLYDVFGTSHLVFIQNTQYG